MTKNKDKKIEEKYIELSDVEHVLLKPSMYIGSTKISTTQRLLFDGNKMVLSDVSYIPAFIKLFDEIITNSLDEHKRKGTKLKTIKVNVKDNKISILDDGGIDVKIHPVAKCYLPEMLFSRMRTSSNYNEDDQRTWNGTNGIGSTATAIFSKEFTISTCDGKNNYIQTFKDNLKIKSKPKISKSTKNHTKIEFLVDFKRFGLDGIDDNHLKMIYQRTLDLAGSTPSIKIFFNDKEIKIKSFEDYIKLYTSDYIVDETKHKWNLAIAPSEIGFQHVSFVNGCVTFDGGTHTDYILNQIITKVREFILKKHKIDVKPSEIKNHMFIFLNAEIVNPSFNSQTKEKLITEVKDFGTEYTVSDKFIQQIIKSEIVKSILDWYQQKKEADENKELRKLNKSLSSAKIDKLIDAKSTSNRDKCEFFIVEGDSALNPIKKFRNPTLQGCYPLRGKFTNVMDVSTSKLMQDEQVIGIMGALGLKFGEEPKNLRYGKIYILTDSDVDGSSIAAALINFFYKYWKKLFEEGRIYINVTPLLVAINKKTKNRLYFYNDKDFVEWQKKINIKDYETDYKKGLASLNNLESKKMLEEPRLLQLRIGENTSDVLYTWFGDNTQLRKDQLVDK